MLHSAAALLPFQEVVYVRVSGNPTLMNMYLAELSLSEMYVDISACLIIAACYIHRDRCQVMIEPFLHQCLVAVYVNT